LGRDREELAFEIDSKVAGVGGVPENTVDFFLRVGRISLLRLSPSISQRCCSAVHFPAIQQSQVRAVHLVPGFEAGYDDISVNEYTQARRRCIFSCS
jgi:hypothetical protein